MADRDLTYRISAAVTGVQPVDDLAKKLSELEGSVTTLDSTDATVDVKAGPNLDTTATDVDTVATDVENLDGETAEVDVDASGVDEAAAATTELGDSLRDLPVVGDALGTVVDNLDKAGGFGAKAAQAIGGFIDSVGGMGVVGGAIGIVSSVWGAISERAEEARQKAAAFAEEQRKIIEDLQGADIESAAQGLVALYGDAYDAATKFGLSASEVTEFITGQADAVPGLVAQYDALAPSIADTEQAIRDLEDPTSEQVFNMRQAAQAGEGQRAALNDVAGALADARRSYRETNGTIEEQNEQLQGTMEGLEGAATEAQAAATSNEDYAESAEAAAQAAAELDAGARSLAETIGSADWGAAAVQGASSAFSDYTTQMFATENQAQSMFDAVGRLGAQVEENGLRIGEMSEAGFAQQDALEGIANVIDQQLVGAFDRADGSLQSFSAQASSIAADLRGTLINDLGLTVDEADQVIDSLGLLDDSQIEARFNLAGAEEARIQLGLLQTAITGLPPEVELSVNQKILAGDYVAARDEIQAFYDDNPTFLETQADMEGAEDTIQDTLDNIPEGTMYVAADTDEAEGDMDAAAAAAPDATIVADADTVAAASDLLRVATMPRGAIIRAEAWTDTANGMLNLAARDRTSTITAEAHTGSANAELNYAARDRYSTIHVRTVSSGGGGGGSTGGASPSAAAAPALARGLGAQPATAASSPVTSALPVVVLNQPRQGSTRPINVTVQAAVIGSVYDVQRAVTRAVAGAERLGRRA